MAKRDKLTQRQKRQIEKTLRRKTNDQSRLSSLGQLGTVRQGLLVSRYGEQADIRDAQSAEIYRCFLRQNLGAPVPGDNLTFRLDPNNHGVIESILPRSSLLQRPSPHQGLKPVVANINRVFVLVAPLPDFSSVLLDRYLIAIENAKLDIVIVANKWDLEDEIKQQQIAQQLEIYDALGYPILKISTKTNLAKDRFLASTNNHASILVGQSGVGKSSLINWLFPEQSLQTKAISDNSRLGQHTTTASQLFCLQEQDCSKGFIIDSPGIREFGLWHLENDEIASGFREFQQYLGSCKYRDCQHTNEPGCSILQAVKLDKINRRRWQNYVKILSNNQPKQ